MTIEFERADYDLICGLLTEALDETCEMLIFESGQQGTVDKLVRLAKARNNLRHTYRDILTQ